MTAKPPYSTYILACMEDNLRRAKTRAMREHLTERLAAYRKHLAPRPVFNNPMERFANSL